jgi:hypothetical protein
VPGLLLAQQVAGAAQVEVAGADGEAGADAVQRLQGAEPPVRGGRGRGGRVGQQVDHAAHPPAPHPPAELVELRQAEAVGAPDQHGVGARHVEPGFHDVGGEQRVRAAGREAHQRLVHLGGRHAAVRDQERQVGQQPGDALPHRLDVLDARADHEALAAAPRLAPQRLGQQRVVQRRARGADGLPPRRRRGDDAEGLQADQRRLQGARDGRGRQRQYVDALAHLAQGRLLPRAETLLLVDHHQAEVLEAHALGRQRVGADGDADLAGGEGALGFLRLGRRRQARERPDPQAEAGETLAEGLQVLARQHGGGRQHSHLLARQRRYAAARSATSVLPKPTSPQTSRSIGRPEDRSRRVSAMALAWSGVSGKGKRSAKRA